jgi:hypothetical protein
LSLNDRGCDLIVFELYKKSLKAFALRPLKFSKFLVKNEEKIGDEVFTNIEIDDILTIFYANSLMLRDF